MVVSDGQRLAAGRAARGAAAAAAQRRQIVRALNRVRRNNTLYVKLLSGDAGAVVNGEPLSSLPPSVLAVLESDRSGGTFNPLHSATLGEWELPTDHAISGVRTLTIRCLVELTPRGDSSTFMADRLVPASRHARRRRKRSTGVARRRPCRCARGRSCRRRRPSSSRSPRRPTSSRATSTACRSTRRGQLSIGAANELVYETAAPFLWAMVPGSRRVALHRHRQRRQGLPDRRQTARARCSSTRRARGACAAPAPDGGLYVGTSPDGKIYKVDRRGDGDDVLRARREVHLGAGVRRARTAVRRDRRQGRVYKIAPDGKGARSTRRRRRTSRRSPSIGRATLLVGTESPGRVLRSTPRARRFCSSTRRSRKSDRCASTTRACSTSRRSTAAPARRRAPRRRPRQRRRRRAPEPSRQSGAVGVGRDHAVAVVDTPSSGASGGRAARRPAHAQGRGLPDRARRPLGQAVGVARRLAVRRRCSTRQGGSSSAPATRARCTGSKATRCSRRCSPRAGGQQVTALHRDAAAASTTRPPTPASCTGSQPTAPPRAPTSRRRATPGWSSTWGAISWRGTTPAGSRIEISTRSGNTETPDDTWSPWSAPYTAAEGSPITSPKARYLQWRAVADRQRDGRSLTSVTAAYLQRNLRPQVQSITVHPPGIVFQKPYSTGDPDLAGFEDQTTPDRRLTQAAHERRRRHVELAVARPPDVSEGTADARSGAPTTRTTTICRSTFCTAAKASRLEGAAARRHRTDSRLGHHDRPERHVLRPDRRVGRSVESRPTRRWPARSTARRSTSTTRRPPSTSQPRTVRQRHDRRSRST